MARGLGEYAVQVDQATPDTRDRLVDLLRAVAIGAVVLGHWLASVAVTGEDGRLSGESILAIADWTHWLTWLFQVMPVFFFVGGYANAISWRRHAEAGGHWAAWVHRRSMRLLRPTAVFVAVAAAAVMVANLVGADPDRVEFAAWVVGIPLWFLAVYVAVAGLTPLTDRLHHRFGIRAAAVPAVAVAAGDVARLLTTEPAWAGANFVLGWLLIHQCGYWWHDGALPSGVRGALALCGGGAVALLGLVVLGPWPAAMVDVPGATIQNSSPPSLALLALFSIQAGLVLAVAEPARAWLQRPLPWAVVSSVNRVILTLFLWHMTAVVAGAAALHATGLLPEPEPASAAWFAWRPVWLLGLGAIAAALVAALLPVEQRAARPVAARAHRPALASVLVACGVPAACGSLSLLTLGGLSGEGPLGLPIPGVAGFAAGVVMTALAGRFLAQPERP